MKERLNPRVLITPGIIDYNDANRNYSPYIGIHLKECPIAGLSFHVEPKDELWDELYEGAELALVRDRNNTHDPNAVAVALADDYDGDPDGDPDDFDFDLILGYIPRTDNAEIAAMMDAGYADKFSARITSLKRYGTYSERIRIAVYIESRNPVVRRPDLLRINWLDDKEHDDMLAELRERGFTTFRWGGFPPDERNLPEAGDKVVMLHEDKEQVSLHLMHVLMTGDDCMALGLSQDDVLQVDDCIHFALTVVAGPLTMNRSDLTFLTRPDFREYTFDDNLTPAESDTMKKLFGITHAVRQEEI